MRSDRSAWQTPLFPLILLGLAFVQVVDQIAWNHADQQPMAREDSALHALASMMAADGALHHGPPLGLSVFWQTGYYPPFTYWLSIPAHAMFGLDPSAYRDTLALFSGALVLGLGTLAGRLWGQGAGVAAAGLALCSPGLWVQRPEAMLDAPLAGALAFALALLPDPDTEPRPAFGAGLAAGLMVMTKQSGLFFLAPMALALLIRALRAPAPRRALLGAAAWGLGAALMCLPWLLRSLHFFSKVLENVAEQHQLPEGLAGLIWRLSWLVFLKEGLLAPPLLPLLLLGLGVALWRRPPLLPVVLLVLFCGFLGFSNFPDAHERHFVPLQPLLLVIAVAPLALLPSARAQLALGLALALLGVGANLSWRLPELLPEWRVALSRDASLRRSLPTQSPAQLLRELAYAPAHLALLAPLPRGIEWPTRPLVQAVLKDSGKCNDPQMDSGAVLLSMEARVSADLLATDAVALGCHVLRARSVEPQQLDRWLQDHSRDVGAGVYALLVADSDPRQAEALERANFQEMQRLPASEGNGSTTALVLYRR